MPDRDVDERWAAYRLVDRGWASLGEIHTMTFDDLELANLAADAIDVAREGARPRVAR